MPAKKKPVEEKKPLLGRPGNTLKMGIVGLPNVGKSSTFNLLSNLSVPAENYPFCTIDPSEARVPIPDQRFDRLCDMFQPRSRVPGILSITDIAGLVPGASEGAGLGNAFLSHINAVDGIYHVVRAFANADVIHTEGEVDPIRDLEIISRELCLKDLERANLRIEEIEKQLKRAVKKELTDDLEILVKIRDLLTNFQMLKDQDWLIREIEVLNSCLFLTAKPIVYLVNLTTNDYLRKKNKWLAGISKWVNEHGGGPIIPYSIEFEEAIHGMDPEARAAHLTETGTISMIPRILKTGYSALQLIHYFTSGEDEVKCWTIRKGTKAPGAAGVIHTDFEKGFICAEVMKFEDLMELGNETAVKAQGKLRQCGKEYEVEDGDIIFFRFNVSSGDFEGPIAESTLLSCLYLSRISKTQLIQAINKFRENLIPLENRVQIDQKIAEVFDASIETQLPDTNHNINYENRVFLLRLDNRNELSEKARSILLTPLGISEALKVIFEFCDKGCFGFLTGDMSYELYEFLLRDLYRIDLRKHSVNVEIYKELTKFLSKEDLSLPKYGIKSMAHENPQALFLRELKIEEDSSRVSTELENNEVEFLSKRAFGLEVSTKKEEIIRLFKPFCEALKMEKGSLSENSSHAIYFEKLEVDQIATLCYKSILVLISPSVNEDYESVKIQLKDVISKIAADIKLQLGHIEKTQIIEEYNKIRVENHKKPIKDTFLLQRSNFKITENMKNHAINNENAIIDFATLVLNTMMKTSQIKDHFGDVVNGVTLIDSKKSSLRNSSGKVLFKTDFLKIILSKMGDIKKNETVVALEKTLPMIYPPKDWTCAWDGGYFQKPFNIARLVGSDIQRRAINRGNLTQICDVLNVMGRTSWKINSRILSVVETIHRHGGGLGEIPYSNVEEQFPVGDHLTYTEQNKIIKEKRDNWSLLSDFEIKLGIARKFKNIERFYLPLNLDFRGRIYPISPHLNQLGNDISRGLLEFAHGKKLGESGLRWLKIHLSNKMGFDKLKLEKRVEIVENKLEEILKMAKDPIENREWLTWEDPWQSLAAIFDLSDALAREDPTEHISYLHVHQDGSCNGLQHYAAMGRDIEGAEQVNLIDKDEPGDLYTAVALKVQNVVNKEAEEGNELAKLLTPDKIKRKIVKQTVMTSVYGVTYIGARDQILKQLKERSVVSEDKQWECASYLAKHTMESVSGFFKNAQQIKNWLIDSAGLIARNGYPVSWITPMGFPVVQPYRVLDEDLSICTVLQKLRLVISQDNLPLSVYKQKSAFPPNYVHSLDSTHLMKTALRCHKLGIEFAAVHDSYWTHACDIDVMNKILREEFVDLHSQPLLEDLSRGFKLRFPNIKFRQLPKRGNFNLDSILHSKYFFA